VQPIWMLLRLVGAKRRSRFNGAPGGPKTRPAARDSNSWNRFSFASPRFIYKNRFNEPLKEILVWETARQEPTPMFS
jgi:hypothetical protein